MVLLVSCKEQEAGRGCYLRGKPHALLWRVGRRREMLEGLNLKDQRQEGGQLKRMSVEVIALRKMRELKGLSRKEAGALFGLSHKTIEKMENGRSCLTQEKINRFICTYGFNREDFKNLCQGKVYLIKEKYFSRGKLKEIKRSSRRSYQKVITKETKALMSLRQKLGISQNEASRRCGYARSVMGHIENGRINLYQSRIEHILKSYGFSMEDFKKEIESEFVYSDLLKNCFRIIKELEDKKLISIYQILKSLRTKEERNDF